MSYQNMEYVLNDMSMNVKCKQATWQNINNLLTFFLANISIDDVIFSLITHLFLYA